MTNTPPTSHSHSRTCPSLLHRHTPHPLHRLSSNSTGQNRSDTTSTSSQARTMKYAPVAALASDSVVQLSVQFLLQFLQSRHLKHTKIQFTEYKVNSVRSSEGQGLHRFRYFLQTVMQFVSSITSLHGACQYFLKHVAPTFYLWGAFTV